MNKRDKVGKFIATESELSSATEDNRKKVYYTDEIFKSGGMSSFCIRLVYFIISLIAFFLSYYTLRTPVKEMTSMGKDLWSCTSAQYPPLCENECKSCNLNRCWEGCDCSACLDCLHKNYNLDLSYLK